MKEISRQKRDNYNRNPNICLTCSSPIFLFDFQKYNDVIEKKFCNRSCAAKYNNNKFPKKRHPYLVRKVRELKGICSCGNKKNLSAKFCHQCKINNTLQKVLNTPVNKYFRSNRNKHGDIRGWANIILERSGRKKTCEFCNSSEFDEIVEACHIKELVSFPETALMGEVNSLDNLKYLCPNHHKLLDKKLIDVFGNRIIKT